MKTQTPQGMRWLTAFSRQLRSHFPELHVEWAQMTDPLHWRIRIYASERLSDSEWKLARAILQSQAEENDCLYRRSQWHGREFTALVLCKDLERPTGESEDESSSE